MKNVMVLSETEAYAKLHHDMQHFVSEASVEQLMQIKQAIADSARRAMEAAPTLMIEYKLPVITVNPDGSLRGKGGLLVDEAVEFAKELEKAGVDMIQVAQANHTGNMGDTIPPMGTMPINWTLDAAKKVKAVVNVPIATVGRVITVANGEEILANGDADMVGYGRSLLCDPDIALKVERDEPIRECLNCNKGCVDAIQGCRYISCVLNAENGDA